MIGERNSGVLPVHSMAGDAIVPEGLFAVSNGVWRDGQRVLLFSVPNKNVVFRKIHRGCFKFSRTSGFAACGHNGEQGAHREKKPAHGYATTWSVNFIEPWPEPQKTEQ